MTTTDKSLKDVAIKIKGKSYVLVKDRVQYLSDNYEGRYSIETQYDYFPERKLWVVKAELSIRDENHEYCCVYNGLAQEIETDKIGLVNTTSVLENCESSAVGRACAMAGIGILESIASADEMNKAMNREKAMKQATEDVLFTDDTPSNPEPTWFEKAKQGISFMQSCLDEDDFVNKIKNRVSEIGAKMTKQQETDLRICYQNAKAMENLPTDSI